MVEISLQLKLSAISILLFVATAVLSVGHFSARASAAGLFLLSLAGYLGCQICHLLHIGMWFIWFVHLGCFGVSFAFYTFAESIFTDAFRFQLKHLLLFIFVESVNFTLVFYLRIYRPDSDIRFGEIKALLKALPQIISFGFILVALFSVMAKRQADLIEARRKFRVQFLVITSACILFILITEIIYQHKKAPDLLDLIRSGAVLLLVWYFGVRLFGAGLADSRNGRKKNTTAAVPDIDQALLARLEHAMQKEKIFTRESLSIRELAQFLQTQEYILRKLINSALGYKNFNDYVNEFRIQEARRLLSDKSHASLPILRLAMDLGFGSLAPFNRAFKEKTGMPPGEFRKTVL